VRVCVRVCSVDAVEHNKIVDERVIDVNCHHENTSTMKVKYLIPAERATFCQIQKDRIAKQKAHFLGVHAIVSYFICIVRTTKSAGS